MHAYAVKVKGMKRVEIMTTIAVSDNESDIDNKRNSFPLKNDPELWHPVLNLRKCRRVIWRFGVCSGV